MNMCSRLSVSKGKSYGILATLMLGVLMWTHGGCSEPETLSKKQAQALLVEAQQLEARSNLQAAYYKYKNVETSYEVNDGLRSAAWDGAQRVRALVAEQQEEVEAALRRYFARNGTYPDSLSAINDELTDATRAAVAGFRYTKVSGTEFKLEDGIIG
jgi:hypothetical protein